MDMHKITFLSILIILFGCRHEKKFQVACEGTAWAIGSFNSNGEQIYFTGTSNSGTPVTFTGGPDSVMMLTGGTLACVSCHGINAHGIRHVAGKEIMHAPDLRWPSLTKMKQKVESKGEHEQLIGNYNFDDFKKEVVDGKELDGDKLDEDMPRWKMSDEDLKDLMNYLKTLD